MTALPINIDCGENFGRYRLFDEQPITRLATLANVACGFHAGDYTSIITTLELMKNNGIKVGAHPSFPDLQGFGRRYMQMEFDDLVSCIFYQIATLKGLCESMGTKLNHVKAHGALYNASCVQEKEALAMVHAVKKVSADLTLLTMPDSVLEKICVAENFPLKRESFADRAYQTDLSLVDRNVAGAVITDPEQVKKQYEALCSGYVFDIHGNRHSMMSDTVCIHGDHPGLVEIGKMFF